MRSLHTINVFTTLAVPYLKNIAVCKRSSEVSTQRGGQRYSLTSDDDITVAICKNAYWIVTSSDRLSSIVKDLLFHVALESTQHKTDGEKKCWS